MSPSQLRRPTRSLKAAAFRQLLLGSAVIGAAIAAVVLLREPPDRDRLEIEVERASRLGQAVLGQPLAGTPDLADLPGRLAARGLVQGAPVFIRIFKREFELELWMRRESRFERFAVYPICRWSGHLGPKLQEGDSQAPEGFYTVDSKALNPASRWHRSFNLGFPNVFDRANNRTGSFVMVHGGCASVGCFAMTDAVVEEIWALVTAALKAGQKRFHVHVFPFRMTEENLARRSQHPWAEFWRDLKSGHDAFDAAGLPPRIGVCAGRYAVAQIAGSGDGSHEIAQSCINLTGN